MNVAAFVSTRADLSPMSPVIAELAAASDIDLAVICGIAVSAADVRAALGDPLPATGIHELPRLDGRVDSESIAREGIDLTAGIHEVLDRLQLDAIVVLGDRWELLYVVPAAFLAGVRIVHIHGGEVTEGAIDERVRHAVTKLADVHCVASVDARNRVRQMGEPEGRIHLTGAPGLDRYRSIERVDDASLGSLLGSPVARPLALFTIHPATAAEYASAGRLTRDALQATLEHCATVIATDPGMDDGRDQILAVLDEFAGRDDRVVRVPSLGAAFPVVVASVDVVVGNSSAGIIEAPAAGVPSVDVGVRQAGRLRAASVLTAAADVRSVGAAVSTALRDDMRSHASSVPNPYGDGRAAPRILAAVRTAADLSMSKPFVSY
ncbi:UDP-N-acetylglucosamine 2-epimerase [Agromyces sp. LHK192]|uniref:UDP-N-acetylglucosamine 2-epimerase n=1 Tax=Agromyces sp. LHK192 TaxID=2498704 RepID=UPI000FD92610|nr:UDP-N-acetylglucosamine 2-epimerase [Agromyces sp. LHK192]